MTDGHHDVPAASATAIRRALAVMTAWCDDEASTSFMRAVVEDFVAEGTEGTAGPGDGPAAGRDAARAANLRTLNVGLSSLAGLLLLHLAQATGREPSEILRSYATFFALLEAGDPPPH